MPMSRLPAKQLPLRPGYSLIALTPPTTPAPVQTHRLLRGKALECISLVGMAVGKDRFREDAA